MSTLSRLSYPEPSLDFTMPSVAKRWTMRRQEVISPTVTPLLTGRLTLHAISLFEGDVVNTISFMSGSTAGATLTHTWFSLYDSARAKLGVTNDDTAATWAVNTLKTLTLASPYTVPTSGLYYLGICVVGTTIPSLFGNNSFGSVVSALVPILHGSSTTGLTTPATAPATAAALTALQGSLVGWTA